MENDIFLEPVDFNPFPEKEIEKIVGMVDAQKEMWLSAVVDGVESNLSYNESISLDLKGDLDIPVLQASFDELVRRHESLRMTFSGDGKTSIIYDFVSPDFLFEDLSQLPKVDKDLRLEHYLDKAVTTPFDLKEGPLLRIDLLKLEGQHHFMLITAHHLVCDGWSIGVIVLELSTIYSQLVQGLEPVLAPADSYSEYAETMLEYKGSEEFNQTEGYWIELFKGKVPGIEIPIDFPRPEVRTLNGHRLDFELPLGLVTACRKTGVMAKTSLVNTLLCGFEIFLHKLTGQRQMVLGLPVAGQSISGNFSLVGHAVHLLAIPSEINPGLSFLDYLKKRKTELLDNYDHAKYSSGNLFPHLNIPRDISKILLIPVVFNIDMGMDQGVAFHGLNHTLITNPRKYEYFEIFLNITEIKGRLILEWTYNSDLFKPSTIEEMMRDYQDILSLLTDTPETLIKEVDLVQNEFLKRIQPWNETYLEYPKDKIFTDYISEQSKRQAIKIAVRSMGSEISYRELEEKSNQVSHYLVAMGIKKGDVVGICVDRSVELLISLLGIIKSGAAYLPLDPVYPKDRIEFMVEDASCKYFLVSERLKDQYQTNSPMIVLEEMMTSMSGLPGFASGIDIKGQDLAYVIYTSGSTGQPKGVQVSHQNLINFLLSMQIAPGISQEDQLLAVTTVSFDIAGLELFLPLISGAKVVLADAETSKDGRGLVELIERERITMMQATPATWRMMLHSSWKKHLPIKVLCGGEALPQDLALELFQNADSLWNVYGPTETTIWSLVKEIKDPNGPITIGRPIHNTQVYVVDKYGHLLPAGNVGEIWIGGDGVSKGYLNRPLLTKEKFVPNDFEPSKSEYLYRTGDLGKFQPNGELVCLGRVDHQVKIRGYRIELGEIENKINQFPEIEGAIVIAREDNPGDKRLAAYVVLKEDESLFMMDQNNLSDTAVMTREEPVLTKEKILGWKETLKTRLPNYMIPNDWVALWEFPMTDNNKIDRNSLPIPLRNVFWDEAEENLPQNPNQILVAGIWSKVLGVSDVRLWDDFFELGGHSLLAVRVMAELAEETGLNLPLNTLIINSTLENFAAVLDRQDQKDQDWSSLVPIKKSGKKAPIYLIHGAGSHVSPFFNLAKNLDEDQPVYGLQAKGLNGIDEPLQSIKEMAAHYIQEIVTHNPHGPYHIGGQSFGAYVAFEMARQMKASGLDIQKVILFDVSAYQEDFEELSSWERMKKEVGYEFQKRYMDIELLVKSPSTLRRLKTSSLERKTRALKRFLGIDAMDGEGKLFHVIEKIRRINHKAMDDYELAPYNGDIILFKAKIKTFYDTDMEYYGWKPYVKEVHTVEMEGDHNSMFEDPELVKILGRKLQEVLDKDIEMNIS
ncbi:amino acid adenylation domain-containing protein [Rhodonellum sp.]|uniref:non-ribosomal peptide synthetase n=1 Tax=Rhodonellum sp. TaxID=2231180 RepID=UPI0027220101|nr:non-ribosomal peptide synthetase [Rhodonellum sp.]MDO9551820.1 amino acid adenylation domain-containing protein [Rhodonellum sp.]